MVRAVLVASRVLALFFVLELIDVPGVCPDEWLSNGSSVCDVTSTDSTLFANSVTHSRLVSTSATTQVADCGCPCHQNFGNEIEPQLAPPGGLAEQPELPGISSPQPLASSLDHPPQNLA